MDGLKDKAVVITGGTSGIGRAAAALLYLAASKGAIVNVSSTFSFDGIAKSARFGLLKEPAEMPSISLAFADTRTIALLIIGDAS